MAPALSVDVDEVGLAADDISDDDDDEGAVLSPGTGAAATEAMREAAGFAALAATGLEGTLLALAIGFLLGRVGLKGCFMSAVGTRILWPDMVVFAATTCKKQKNNANGGQALMQ